MRKIWDQSNDDQLYHLLIMEGLGMMECAKLFKYPIQTIYEELKRICNQDSKVQVDKFIQMKRDKHPISMNEDDYQDIPLLTITHQADPIYHNLTVGSVSFPKRPRTVMSTV